MIVEEAAGFGAGNDEWAGMKIRAYKRFAFLACGPLLLLVAVLGVLTWRAWQQERLNQELIAAIHSNHAQQVRYLLAQKADPNTQELLYYQLFLDRLHGSKIHVTSAPNALIVALYLETDDTHNKTAQAENKAVIQALLDAGANTNIHYRDGDTPLMIAVWQDKPDVVRMLLDRGVDVQARNTFGATALMRVAGTGDARLLSLLLAKGADINAKDNYGCNALRFAILYGQVSSVKMLLKRGIDVNAKDSAGLTALTAAKQVALPQIISLLQQAGANE